MFDFGGKFIIPIKMRKFDSIHKTIDYVIIPEIFTEYIMEKTRSRVSGCITISVL